MPRNRTAPSSKRNGTGKEAREFRLSLFVERLIQHGNKTRAAMETGSTSKSADTEGQRLAKDPFVVALLAKRRTEVKKALRIQSEQVLMSMQRGILFDPRKLFAPIVSDDGKALLDDEDRPRMRRLEVWELDDDTALAIQGVEFDEITSGKVVVGQTMKLKACDRNVAREQGMKHFGLYEKDNDQRGDAAVAALIAAVGERPEKFKVKP